MDTFIRKSGQQCDINAGLYSHPCHGDIVEHFTYYSQRTGSLRIGGRNNYEEWIESEFYCEKCGIVYKATLENDLKELDHSRVQNFMESAIIVKLTRELYQNEFVSLDPKAPVKTSLKEWDDFVTIEDKEKMFPEKSFIADALASRNHIIIKPKKNAELFNPITNRLKDGSKRKKLKKAGLFKIPKNAVSAVSIFLYDNELNLHEYLVPADVVKTSDEE